MASRHYEAHFDSKVVEITLATESNHVTTWIKSLSLKGPINLGFAAYWRKNEATAHTLSLCYGEKALVMDLDSIEETSSCLKALLKKSKIHGHKAFAQVEKLKHLGVAFKGVEEVQKKFKNIVEYPKIKDREATKSKKGALSDFAIYVAANESFGCAQFA